MKTIKLSDIKIKESFTAAKPKEEKLEECRNNWQQFHKQDRCIVVNHDNTLIDGYIQYLVLKENNIKEVNVKVSDRPKKRRLRGNTYNRYIPRYKNEKTTYVYGVHSAGMCAKEYIWRVPKSWIWFAENVQAGDIICCNTKFGHSPVIATKVKVLDKCPIDLRVRKVAGREIIRNGLIVEAE